MLYASFGIMNENGPSATEGAHPTGHTGLIGSVNEIKNIIIYNVCQ